MSELRKKENLKKLSLVELKELLDREKMLLKNKNLIKKLPDKGESIKIFRENVEKEIKYRENSENLERSLNKLALNDEEKFVQRLFGIEKLPEKDRYKPFSTLNKVKEVQPNSKIFEIMEDCAHSNKPTKLILLPESLDLLKKQDSRTKEEQLRTRHQRILAKFNEENEDSSSGSEEEFLDHENESND